MKGVLQLTKNCSVVLIALSIAFFITSCDGDEDTPKVIPEVTTAAISNITTTSATGGGNIVSDGNDQIAAMGIVYSSTNSTPTTADSKTVVTSSATSFTSELTGLTSGTTYHVRAYVTNSVGTAYGTTIDFTTGNSAPTVSDAKITGELAIDAVLTASYTYDDAENDLESGTMFKWYSATDQSGAEETVIDGAINSTYTIKVTDEFKYIRASVTPRAFSGSINGIEVKSGFVGPVPEAPETIIFTYNGQSVTYGVITSSVTGRKWLDRNLGAKQAASTFNDYLSYGDSFQWGRLADEHQLVTRIDASTSSPEKGTTFVQSSEDIPVSSLYVIYSIEENANPNTLDWRNPQNNNLWNAPDFINNPCPSGWHIPTSIEWGDENISNRDEAFTQLKLPAAGQRRISTGEMSGTGDSGFYWSSSTSTTNPIFSLYYGFPIPGVTPAGLIDGGRRMLGCSCRCIENSNTD